MDGNRSSPSREAGVFSILNKLGDFYKIKSPIL